MLDKLVDALGAIVPPVSGDPKAHRRWQQSVSIGLCGLSMFVGFHVAWACGWLPGLPGFAMAADVERLQMDVRRMLVAQVRSGVFEVRQKQCEAGRAGRPQSVYTAKLQDLLDDYEQLTNGATYRLPSCEEM